MKAKSQNSRIVVLTRYNQQFASARVRFLQYADFWRKAGRTVAVAILLDEKFKQSILTDQKFSLGLIFHTVYCYLKRIGFVLFTIKRGDIVFIQLEILPMFPSLLERYLAWRKIPFVIDFDDAFFDFYEKSNNKWVTMFLKNKFSNVVAKANWNITGSAYLTDYALKRTNKVTEIPTSVLMKDYAHQTATQNNVFTIGWIGSPSTSKFIDDIAEVLIQFLETTNSKLLLVGYEGSILKNHSNISNEPWDISTEVAMLHQLDVGIMPLRNDGFSLGKCGFKLIQYMACGKPTISTPLPANVNIDGGTGNLFANNHAEWLTALEAVYNNSKHFREVGIQNRTRVINHYTIEANYGKYLDIFNKL